MTAEHDWKRLTLDLLNMGITGYFIAKHCCDFDAHKVRRWASGKSIPNADEGPKLLRLHAANVSHGTNDVASLSSQAISNNHA
jgi:hypothetical protein